MAYTFRVFHLIQRAHSALFRAAENRLRREIGISVSQHAVLSVLASDKGMPVGEIAAVLGMSKSSLSGLLDRMSEKRLIRRRTNPLDARVQEVSIEPEGQAMIEQSRFTVRYYNQRLLQPFNDDERRVIESFLIHLADNAAEIIEPAELRRRSF